MQRFFRGVVASALFALLIATFSPSAAFGQAAATSPAPARKDLTLQRLFSPPFLFGHLTQGIEWAPDGKEFSYLDRQGTGKEAATELWTMSAATGERKVLVNAATLKEVMQPEKAKTTQATGLGRVQAENYLWAPDGKSLLFIGSNSLVLLDLKTMTSKPIASSEQEIEDPKFSPDSEMDQFFAQRESFRSEYRERRHQDSDERRQRGNSEGQSWIGCIRKNWTRGRRTGGRRIRRRSRITRWTSGR